MVHIRNITENNNIRFIIHNDKGEKINIIDDVGYNNIHNSCNNTDIVSYKYIIQNLENIQPAKPQPSLYIISLWNTVIDDIVYNIIVKLNNQIITNDWIYEKSNYFMYNINYDPYLKTKKQDDSVLEVLINKYKANWFIKYMPCMNNTYYNIIYNFTKPKLSMSTLFKHQEFKTTDSTNQEIQEFKTTDSTNQEIQEFKTTDSTNQEIQEFKTTDSTNQEIQEFKTTDSTNQDIIIDILEYKHEYINKDASVEDASVEDASAEDDFEKIDMQTLRDILDNSTNINIAADNVNSLLDKIDIKNLDSTYINDLEYFSELP
jgi:hypothetical protein